MKRITCVSVILVVLFVFGLMFFHSNAESAQQEVIKLKFTNFWPAPHNVSITAEQWAREVEKRSNGRVKISYFPAATLTPPAQTYDSIVKGIADMGMSLFGYTRGKFPLTEVIDLPLGYKSGSQATKLINAYYKKFKPKEMDDVKILFLHAHGPGLIHTAKKPVRTMADLRGLKIRSHGLSAKVVQALGGAPVGMPMTETYDALSKGVAEGVMCPYEGVQGFKLTDVIKYTTEDYPIAYTSGVFFAMNKAKWNSLPPDIKKIMEEVSEEWIIRMGKVWDDFDKNARAEVVRLNKTIVPLSKEEGARWGKQVQPILDEYVKNTKKRGLPGGEALKFCQDFLKANPN
jgi:TRAP-type C4-dicarboxylate transport system substrate-binding protein